VLKVLVMYSWDDDTSKRRWEWLSKGADLQGIVLSQCFALNSSKETVSSDRVCQRLVAAIENLHPDIVLIHTGAAYHRAPSAFAEVARTISGSYPNIRLGFERRYDDSGTLESTGVFDRSEDTINAERMLFSW